MESYQIEKIEEFRTKKVLSIFPFIIINGFDGDFHWTGKWFKYVEITQQKVRERYLKFDDGWSYQHYWSDWEYNWKFISLNDTDDNIEKINKKYNKIFTYINIISAIICIVCTFLYIFFNKNNFNPFIPIILIGICFYNILFYSEINIKHKK
jgi:hypothetical protein